MAHSSGRPVLDAIRSRARRTRKRRMMQLGTQKWLLSRICPPWFSPDCRLVERQSYRHHWCRTTPSPVSAPNAEKLCACDWSAIQATFSLKTEIHSWHFLCIHLLETRIIDQIHRNRTRKNFNRCIDEHEYPEGQGVSDQSFTCLFSRSVGSFL